MRRSILQAGLAQMAAAVLIEADYGRDEPIVIINLRDGHFDPRGRPPKPQQHDDHVRGYQQYLEWKAREDAKATRDAAQTRAERAAIEAALAKRARKNAARMKHKDDSHG